ncbi:MAG: hypothetical protein LBJ02_01715 [Bifidobacteriaceae bacterium]|nr:hypothetical protein [Bifidobacteriaceae bacterium]
MKHQRTIVALAVAAAAFTLTGCDSGKGVASLDDGKGSSNKKTTQAERARDMAKCLQKDGIEVSTYEVGTDEAELSFDGDDAYIVHVKGGGWQSGYGEAATDAESEEVMGRLNKLASKYDPSLAELENSEGGPAAVVEETGEFVDDVPSYLIIEDRDHTEAFTKCLEQTGYTEAEWQIDPAQEIAIKQLMVDPTIKWIKCARQNGYPNMKDPAPLVADQMATSPTAVLPGDITEDALRALLVACPNFDEQAHEAADKEMTDAEDSNMGFAEMIKIQEEIVKKYPGSIDPNIGFDVPGWDGTLDGMDYGDEDNNDAEWERMLSLQEIVNAPSNAYYERIFQEYEEGAVG